MSHHTSSQSPKDLSALQPTERFSNRADNYVKYRPTYPAQVINDLEKKIGLNETSSIADVGSGTGIFSELFLKKGYAVMGVEPNDAMRLAAEEYLKEYPAFKSIKGTSEHTNLPDACADLITVAQAFHWMEPVETKKEFERILKPGGHILLIWNIRVTSTPFLAGLESLKEKYYKEYRPSTRANEEELKAFFHPVTMKTFTYDNEQQHDWEGLKGEVLSSSYMPAETDAAYNNMLEELKQLFDKYNENGMVKVKYETKGFLR